jgi:hypothetical protein
MAARHEDPSAFKPRTRGRGNAPVQRVPRFRQFVLAPAQQRFSRLAGAGLVAHLYADLGVTQSHSRPSVSNDNAFSEAQFKTLKYRPDFPERFGSAQHGRAHCGPFFDWYNREHRHGGNGLLTPHDVHYGLAHQRASSRPRRRARRIGVRSVRRIRLPWSTDPDVAGE